MWFRVFIIVAFITSLVSTQVFALTEPDQTFFDYSLPENLLRDGQEINIKFKYDVKDLDMTTQKRLVVKPIISGGSVEIFNDSLNKYVGVVDLNTTLPYLREDMMLRVSGIQSSESPKLLKFEIVDTLLGKSYSTPEKKVWGTAYYKRYTDFLNENLSRTSGDDKALADMPVDDPPAGNEESRDPVKIYLWYLSPAFFLYGLLKSPNGFG